MRKVTRETVKAFLNGKTKSMGNTVSTGNALLLHGHEIATRHDDGKISISMCGWGTVTTRERLNGLLRMVGASFSISQRNYSQCLVNHADLAIIKHISEHEHIHID
tara:strand:+ start:230 stop:547 length:318 start_codon:yes stop_codon:yes gene_type:complete